MDAPLEVHNVVLISHSGAGKDDIARTAASGVTAVNAVDSS